MEMYCFEMALYAMTSAVSVTIIIIRQLGNNRTAICFPELSLNPSILPPIAIELIDQVRSFAIGWHCPYYCLILKI